MARRPLPPSRRANASASGMAIEVAPTSAIGSSVAGLTRVWRAPVGSAQRPPTQLRSVIIRGVLLSRGHGPAASRILLRNARGHAFPAAGVRCNLEPLTRGRRMGAPEKLREARLEVVQALAESATAGEAIPRVL